MALAHDANTRWPTTDGTTGVNSVDTTTGTRTFTHTPSGTPKGVVVVVLASSTTQPVSEVWYGGYRMDLTISTTEATEAGGVWIYTLTKVEVPTGAQTVTLFDATSASKWATCSTVTAATTGTQVYNSTQNTSASAANPTTQITGYAGTAMSYSGLHSGAAAPATAMGAGTLQHSNDYGAKMANTARSTSPTATPSNIQYTVAADDFAVASVALLEFTLPSFVARPPLLELQAVTISATR